MPATATSDTQRADHLADVADVTHAGRSASEAFKCLRQGGLSNGDKYDC